MPVKTLVLLVRRSQDERDATSIKADPSLDSVLAAAPGGAPAVRQALAALLPGVERGQGLEGAERAGPLAGIRVGVPLDYNVAELSGAAREAWWRGIEWAEQVRRGVIESWACESLIRASYRPEHLWTW